jgi:hypothetical protein
MYRRYAPSEHDVEEALGHRERERDQPLHEVPNVWIHTGIAPSHRHLYAQSLVLHTYKNFALYANGVILTVRYAEIASALTFSEPHFWSK